MVMNKKLKNKRQIENTLINAKKKKKTDTTIFFQYEF